VSERGWDLRDLERDIEEGRWDENAGDTRVG